jgi:MFS superfamily sulfate permease-like transporter
MKKTSLLGGIKENFPSGLVVFLVALPLFRNRISIWSTAIIRNYCRNCGRTCCRFLSNSNISVSGPAAGLTAIVLTAITDLGAFELFFVPGLLQDYSIDFRLCKSGSISNYFPNNVIEGMLAAIGIIIILKQIPHALGFDKDYEGNQSIFSNGLNFNYFTELFGAIHPGAIIVTLVSVGILIAWDKIPALRRMKMLPGALVVVTGIF